MHRRWSRNIAVVTVVVALGAALPLAAVASLATAGVAGAQDVAAGSGSPRDGRSEEQQFIERINALRASKGLATLQVDPELTAEARAWSRTMTDAGHIYHSSDLSVGITADWQKLGENVGVGGEVAALYDAFVASPKHYENLVDPSYRYIGVGVVWDGDRMFTAHRFMALFPPEAPPQPKPKPKPAPKPAPPTTAAPTTAPPTSTVPPPAELAARSVTVAPNLDPRRVELELANLRRFVDDD